MALFLPTTLSTASLKLPLLLGHVVFSYHGMSPPTPPASASEVKRIGSTPDFISQSRFPWLIKGCIATAKVSWRYST